MAVRLRATLLVDKFVGAPVFREVGFTSQALNHGGIRS